MRYSPSSMFAGEALTQIWCIGGSQSMPGSSHVRATFCGAELVLTRRRSTGHLPAETARTSTSFTIFEGTSEIQRMIIGRALTGLDVR